MTSLTNTFRSEDLDYSSNLLSNTEKPLSGLSNLQNRQDKIMNQFEINLSKTMELLNNTSPTNNIPAESSRNQYDSSISHRYSRPELAAQNQLEMENSELRSTIKSLKKENDSLKIDLNMKRSSSRVEEKERSFRGSISDVEDMKIKISSLKAENDSLRQELIRVKTDYSNRFESLRRTNDEVLTSFEEKHHQQLKTIKENYEREIDELRQENKRLESLRNVEREGFAHEKKLYEKENAELLGRINQVLSLNETSNQANENMSSIMFEQVLREKHDLETRYHELFNSYLSMLDHNKNLAGKLDERAKSKARSPERSPPARPESAMGRIAKNKLKSQSSKKRSKEKSIERHVISRTTENFPSEQITSFEDRLIPKKRMFTTQDPPSPMRSALSPKYTHDTENVVTESAEKPKKKKTVKANRENEVIEEVTSGEKKKKVLLIEDPKTTKKRSKSNPRKEKKITTSTTNLNAVLRQTAKTPVNSKTEKKRLI